MLNMDVKAVCMLNFKSGFRSAVRTIGNRKVASLGGGGRRKDLGDAIRKGICLQWQGCFQGARGGASEA